MSSIRNMLLWANLVLAITAVLPKEELRFSHVMEQQLDRSCGLAALATVLSVYWGQPVSEAALIVQLIDMAMPQSDGFDGTISLATMASLASRYGLVSRAFRLDWHGLVDVIGKGYAPVLVHYDRPDGHFALLLGFTGTAAVVADPARGLEVLERRTFESRYSGITMVLMAPDRKADHDMIAAATAFAASRRMLLDKAATRRVLSWH
jgi:hypothetical protein